MEAGAERSRQEIIKENLREMTYGHVPFEPQQRDPIVSLFDRQARMHASKPAIVSGAQQLKYEQLDHLCQRIGREICTIDCDKSISVAIPVSDHAMFAASILGVLRAGAFYVPLGPASPQQRNLGNLQESQAEIRVDRA